MTASYELVRLQVRNAAGNAWTNLTATLTGISIHRGDGDAGTLSATFLDESLDPTTSSTLAGGRPIQVLAQNGLGWTPIYTGVIDNTSVARDLLAPVGKRTVVTLTAGDLAAHLASTPEARGVATIAEIRGLLGGVTFPYTINGETTATTFGTRVAYNDQATLWSQILTTRDSVLGYAWIDGAGRLCARDAALMPASPSVTIGPSDYHDLQTDFATEEIINTVTVEWLRYDIGSDATTAVPYGPYTDAGSIAQYGPRSATFTIQGATEAPAFIQAYAQEILARNAWQSLPARGASVKMTYARMALARLEINDLVTIQKPDLATAPVRITSITHEIKPETWVVTFGFSDPGGVSRASTGPSTGQSYVKPNSINGTHIKPGTIRAPHVDFTARDIHGITTTVTGVAPENPEIGDIWIDTSDLRKMKRWSGSAWAVVGDQRIDNTLSAVAVAQATADGKSRVTYSATAPVNGTSVGSPGDIWFVRTTATGTITAQYECTAANTWASRTLTNSVISSLDAGKITTGTLDTDRIGARTIRTDHLAVTGANLLADPDFSENALGRFWSDNGSGVAINAWSRTGNSLHFVNTAAQQSSYNLPMDSFEVAPGDHFYLSAWIVADVAIPAGGVVLGVRYTLLDGTHVFDGVATPSRPANEWHHIAGTTTNPAPAGVRAASFYIASQPSLAVGNLHIDSVHMSRAVTGELIVDGAVTAKTLAADAITAKHTISGSTIIGTQIYGSTVTAADAVLGQEPVMTPNGVRSSGGLRFYDGSTYKGGVIAIPGAPGVQLTSPSQAIVSGPGGYLRITDSGSALGGLTTIYNQVGASTHHLWDGELYTIQSRGGGWSAFQVNGSGAVYMPALTWTSTSTDAANVRMGSNGRLYYSSASVTDQKLAIENISAATAAGILDVPIVSWFDRTNSEALAAALELEDEEERDEALKAVENVRRIPGVLVDDVLAAGLGDFVQRDADGDPVGVSYDRLALALIPVVKTLRDQLTDLQARVAALETD